MHRKAISSRMLDHATLPIMATSAATISKRAQARRRGLPMGPTHHFLGRGLARSRHKLGAAAVVHLRWHLGLHRNRHKLEAAVVDLRWHLGLARSHLKARAAAVVHHRWHLGLAHNQLILGAAHRWALSTQGGLAEVAERRMSHGLRRSRLKLGAAVAHRNIL